MGINQDAKNPVQARGMIRRTDSPGVQWVTVHNLQDTSLMLPGKYYNKPIPPGNKATFSVRSVADFKADQRIVGFVREGYIKIRKAGQPKEQAKTRTVAPTKIPGSLDKDLSDADAKKAWPHKRGPRNPMEQRLVNMQKELDAAAKENKEE